MTVVIREAIDIEALLIRAYREKALDRLGCEDDRQKRLVRRLIALGAPSQGGGGFNVAERIQTSSYGAKLAARETKLWQRLDLEGSSLLKLHDAVLALPTFYYEPLDDLGFQVWDRETAQRMSHRITVAEGRAWIERVRRRGGSDPKRANELRPAGPARAVTAIEVTTFLICHGRAADRPFVSDVVRVGQRPIYRGANKQAIGYEPVYETPLADVIEARAVYATWHACLGLLVTACADFPDLEVTGPLAPAAPWDEPGIEPISMAKRRSPSGLRSARRGRGHMGRGGSSNASAACWPKTGTETSAGSSPVAATAPTSGPVAR